MSRTLRTRTKRMESHSESHSSEEDFLALDSLPPELFLHICSFLSAKFVINVLSKVCQTFKDLIENDGTWRTRFVRRWPKKYPIVPDTVSDWKEAYVVREEHYDLWRNDGKKMKLCRLKDAHFGAVNIVQLLEEGRLCASGGRDGALKLWNINKVKLNSSVYDTDNYLLHSNLNAHGNAWLWSLAYDDENKVIYSGGFDNKIKAWATSGFCEDLTCYSLSSPVVCLAYYDRLLASGCYGKSVDLFDPRAGLIFSHKPHTRSVICIALDEKYVISGSEDKTVVVFDRVASKVLDTITLTGFPLAMSYDSRQLYIGDVMGSIHVIDPLHNFKLLKSYDSGHSVKVTGIHYSLGSVITCSTDKSIRISEPCDDPKTIAVIKTEAQVSKISAFQTTLVSGNTDDSIYVWSPNEAIQSS